MATADWRPWGVLAGLSALSAGFIAYVIAPASILPLFGTAYSIERPVASASISAVFLTWAILQIPGGYVMDRRDNRRLVLLAAGAFVLVATAGLVGTAYPVFVLSRLVSGGCVVFVFVGSVTILGRILPADRRALGLSVFVASPPLGVAIAQSTAPLLAGAFGWRAPFLAYVALAGLGLLTCLALLRRPITPAERVTVGQFLVALRNPGVLLVSLAGLCTYAIWTFLNTWMPSYGTDVLGIELAAAGAATALVPLAGIVSRPGGGWLADRLGGRPRPVIAASFLATIAVLALLGSAGTPTAFAVALALAGAAVNLSVGLYLVSVNLLADAATQGTSLSVLITASQVGNLAAPVLGGWVIVGYSWSAGFALAGGLALLGLVAIGLVPLAGRRRAGAT